MHAYPWTAGDTVPQLRPAWPFVAGYAAMAFVSFTARWTTEPEAGHG